MWHYLKRSFTNLADFLRDSFRYFRDVLLMHGFILFVLLPLLASLTRMILHKGHITYISYTNLGSIVRNHPGVLAALLGVLLLILLAVFFEFTFLLLSVFFIKHRQPIRLADLLRGTGRQLRKIRPSTILFFLFYFFFLLPIVGLNFNSDLLAKIKIPAFILDFIFAKRVLIVSGVLFIYAVLIYLAIRLLFALPEMILRDVPFKQAVTASWRTTRKRFLAILGQFAIILGSILLLFGVATSVLLMIQALVEQFFPAYALTSAVVVMTALQAVLLLNFVLSTIAIFYIIVDHMDDYQCLPALPQWFYAIKPSERQTWTPLKLTLLFIGTMIFGIGVGTYNTNYLSNHAIKKPRAISHRGVDNNRGVQNTLPALRVTSAEHPDYVEMDIQETKDRQFVVMHDFNLKALTGVNKQTNELTLAELEALTVTENGQQAPVCSFDDYLAEAKHLQQKLLIEIKTTPQDSPDMLERFIADYEQIILQEKHLIHTLDFDTATALKEKEPRFNVGYILPFNIIGPPLAEVDFFTMEHSTLNRNFIQAAHADGKAVYAWTVNDEQTMERMIFYGVDGLITNQLGTLKSLEQEDLENPSYYDKLFHFVIGIG